MCIPGAVGAPRIGGQNCSIYFLQHAPVMTVECQCLVNVRESWQDSVSEAIDEVWLGVSLQVSSGR